MLLFYSDFVTRPIILNRASANYPCNFSNILLSNHNINDYIRLDISSSFEFLFVDEDRNSFQ